MATRTVETIDRTGLGLGFHREAMTRTHWLVAGLAAITGAVHIYLYLTQGFLPFLLAGVGFYAAIVGVLVLPYGHLARRAIYALMVPFTIGQIAAWVALGMPDFTLGVVDKLVQVALIALLIVLFRMETR